MRFLIDENLPRTLAGRLRSSGIDATDVRDLGCGGATDEEVFRRALEGMYVLVTADVGFAGSRSFARAGHRGVVLVRFPNEATAEFLESRTVGHLRTLLGEKLEGKVTVIEPGRIRLRRLL